MPMSRKEKHGRNSPCPCGSGRKFKHCCLHALQAAPQHQKQNMPNASIKEALSSIVGHDPKAIESAVQRLNEFLRTTKSANDNSDTALFGVVQGLRHCTIDPGCIGVSEVYG
jgi:SEC-C motif